MIPGMQMYRGLIGAFELARLNANADGTIVAEILGNFLQASFVIIALAMGLIIASRLLMFALSEPPGPP